jgi:hypothetical protein
VEPGIGAEELEGFVGAPLFEEAAIGEVDLFQGDGGR